MKIALEGALVQVKTFTHDHYIRSMAMRQTIWNT